MEKRVFFRCDDRLVHGQVIYKWIKHLDVKELLIIDDDIAKDIVEKEIIKLATPANVKLQIMPLVDGMRFLKGEIKENTLVLVKKIEVLKHLKENGIEIPTLNIGRIPVGIGRKKYCENIFLSDREFKILDFLKKEGVRILHKITPEEEGKVI